MRRLKYRTVGFIIIKDKLTLTICYDEISGKRIVNFMSLYLYGWVRGNTNHVKLICFKIITVLKL